MKIINKKCSIQHASRQDVYYNIKIIRSFL